jgi:hypothetical protein
MISGVNHKITGADWFLGAFAKLRKATVGFVAPVSPHGALLLQGGFS